MFAQIRLLLGLVLFIPSIAMAAGPAPAPGVNVALPFPAKAPIVVQINGLDQARERLSKMLEALPPSESKQVKNLLESGIKQLLNGRKLSAIPADGRIFLVINDVTKLQEDEPTISLLVPVKSYAEFKNSVLTETEKKSIDKVGDGIESFKYAPGGGDEVTVFMAAFPGHVALSPSKDTALVYVGKYTQAQSSGMGDDLAQSFLTSDVALYVNMDVINDKFGDQIRQFKGLIDFALGQAQMGGMVPGLNKKQMELVKVMLNGFLQGIEDSRGFVLGAEFRPTGLNVRGQVAFADETASAGMLKSESPNAFIDLGKLPAGMTTYGGTHFTAKLADLFRKFAQDFGSDDEDGKIEKLNQEVAAAVPQGDYSATSIDMGLTLTAFKDPAKAAAAQTKIFQSLPAGGKFSSIVLKEKPKVTIDAQSYRGFKFAEVKLAFDFAATVEGLPENLREAALESMKRAAKEKNTFWIGTDGKILVSMFAKDWAAAQKTLDSYLDDKAVVGTEAGFQLTRKNLPSESTAIYLGETSQLLISLLDQVKAAAAQMPGGLPPIGKIKPFMGDKTFVGFALTLKPKVGTFDVFVPGNAMNVAVKMLVPVFRNVE